MKPPAPSPHPARTRTRRAAGLLALALVALVPLLLAPVQPAGAEGGRYPGEDPATPGADRPDFRYVAQALDLERSRQWAHGSAAVMEALFAEEARLRTAIESLTSDEGGELAVRGWTDEAGAAHVAWGDDARGGPPLARPGDFLLTSLGSNDEGERAFRTELSLVSTISTVDSLELSRRLLEQLRGTDADIHATAIRDFPGFTELSGRVFDWPRASLIVPGEGYTGLHLFAPLDLDALEEHYPGLASSATWAERFRNELRDGGGALVLETDYDGADGVLELHAFKRDDTLLLHDGEAPIRDEHGELVPITFPLRGTRVLAARTQISVPMVNLGPVRFGQVPIPWTETELRYEGDPDGTSLRWEVRLTGHGEASPFYFWFLPMDEIMDRLQETFVARLESTPLPADPDLQLISASAEARIPRSGMLDFIASLAGIGDESGVMGDVLLLARDLSGALAGDLDAIAAGLPPAPPPRPELGLDLGPRAPAPAPAPALGAIAP